MTRVRRFYGGQPLHVLATIASAALIAAGFAGWLAPGADAHGVLLWLLGCVVAVELVLLPFAWLLDRIAFGLIDRGERAARMPRGAGRVYVRVPALLSGLMLLVFAPLIFRLGNDTFVSTTGIVPSGYVYRWLFFTAGVFGVSAVLFAARLARTRRRAGKPAG
jgi:hypothetical protein